MICAAFTPVSLSHCASVLLHKHKTGPHRRLQNKQTVTGGQVRRAGRGGKNKSLFLVSSAPNFLLGLENTSPFLRLLMVSFATHQKNQEFPRPFVQVLAGTTPAYFAGPRHRLLSWQKLRRGKDPQLRP